MSQVELDGVAVGKLTATNGPVEVCDAAGQVVGIFLTRGEYGRLLFEEAMRTCPYAAEELAASRAQEGQPLADLWKKLGVQ